MRPMPQTEPRRRRFGGMEDGASSQEVKQVKSSYSTDTAPTAALTAAMSTGVRVVHLLE